MEVDPLDSLPPGSSKNEDIGKFHDGSSSSSSYGSVSPTVLHGQQQQHQSQPQTPLARARSRSSIPNLWQAPTRWKEESERKGEFHVGGSMTGERQHQSSSTITGGRLE